MHTRAFLKPSNLILATSLALASAAASAQTFAPGYFDFKVGSGDYSTKCGVLYSCDTSDTSYGIVYGQELSPNTAMEFGYTDFGSAHRGGGDVQASAATASFVAKLPLDRLSLFAKLGVAYGVTDSKPAFFSDIPAGKGYGWAPHLGVGASVDLNKSLALVAQWEQTNMKFVGEGQEHVESTSIGLRVKF